METSIPGVQNLRHSSCRRPWATRVAAGCIVVATSGWTAGCGASSDDDADETSETSAAPVTVPITDAAPTPTEAPDGSADTVSPDELGDAIGVLYVAVYNDVIAAVEDRPDPAEAITRLTALKEQYIEQLVELGRQRETLDAPSRATSDARVSSAVRGLPAETLTEYQAAIDYYMDDAELDTLIRSFNIIGQYAAFELLREQEPDEAARLGIDRTREARPGERTERGTSAETASIRLPPRRPKLLGPHSFRSAMAVFPERTRSSSAPTIRRDATNISVGPLSRSSISTTRS